MLETETRLAEVDVLRGDRPRERCATRARRCSSRPEAAETGAAPRHGAAHPGRRAAPARRPDGAAADLDESVRVARSGDAVYEAALALDLEAALEDDEEKRRESAETLERLGIQRVARPPLPAGE